MSSLLKSERFALEPLELMEEEEEEEFRAFLDSLGILKPLFELEGLDEPCLDSFLGESVENCKQTYRTRNTGLFRKPIQVCSGVCFENPKL